MLGFLKNRTKKLKPIREQEVVFRDLANSEPTAEEQKQITDNFFAKDFNEQVISQQEYEAFSDKNVTKYKLWTLYFVDRKKVQYKNLIKDSFIDKYLEDCTYVPERVSKEMGIESRMLVSDYKKTMLKKINEQLVFAKRNEQSINKFYSLLKSQAELQLKAENSDYAIAFDQFIKDKADKNRVAESFGGDTLQKYSSYANIPVSVLALHAVFSEGASFTVLRSKEDLISKKGSQSFIETWLKFEKDKKLRSFFEEICGATVILNQNGVATVGSLKNENGESRRGEFEFVLPMASIINDKAISNFSASAIFTDRQYKNQKEALDQKCQSYILEAIQVDGKHAFNENVSRQIVNDATEIVKEIESINNETGEFGFINKNLNRVSAVQTEMALKNYLDNLVVDELEQKNIYVEQYKELHNNFFNAINSADGIDQEIVEALRANLKVVEYDKSAYMLNNYTREFAILCNNAIKIRKIHERYFELIPKYKGKTQLERAQEKSDLMLNEETKINKILKDNNEIIQFVKYKEDVRVWGNPLKQFKFSGMVAAQESIKKFIDEFSKDANEKTAQQKNKIEELSVAIKENESKFTINSDSNANFIKKAYKDQFFKDVTDYFKADKEQENSGGLPMSSIVREALNAANNFGAISSESLTNQSYEEVKSLYVKNFLEIALKDYRAKNTNLSESELHQQQQGYNQEIKVLALQKFENIKQIMVNGNYSPDDNLSDDVKQSVAEIKKRYTANDLIKLKLNEQNKELETLNDNLLKHEKSSSNKIKDYKRQLSTTISKIKETELTKQYDIIAKQNARLKLMSESILENEADADLADESTVDGRLSNLNDQYYKGLKQNISTEYHYGLTQTIEANEKMLEAIKISANKNYDLIFNVKSGKFVSIDNPYRIKDDISKLASDIAKEKHQLEIYNKFIKVSDSNDDIEKMNLINLLPQGELDLAKENINNIEFYNNKIEDIKTSITKLGTAYKELDIEEQVKTDFEIGRALCFLSRDYLLGDMPFGSQFEKNERKYNRVNSWKYDAQVEMIKPENSPSGFYDLLIKGDAGATLTVSNNIQKSDNVVARQSETINIVKSEIINIDEPVAKKVQTQPLKQPEAQEQVQAEVNVDSLVNNLKKADANTNAEKKEEIAIGENLPDDAYNFVHNFLKLNAIEEWKSSDAEHRLVLEKTLIKDEVIKSPDEYKEFFAQVNNNCVIENVNIAKYYSGEDKKRNDEFINETAEVLVRAEAAQSSLPEGIQEAFSNAKKLAADLIDGFKTHELEYEDEFESDNEKAIEQATEQTAEEKKEKKVKTKKYKKPMRIKYTARGCDLALAALKKYKEALDKKSKQLKIEALEANKTPETTTDEVQGQAEANGYTLADAMKFLEESATGENQQKIEADGYSLKDKDVNQKAMLRQGYLLSVYKHFAHQIKAMKEDEVKSLMRDVAQTVDIGEFKDCKTADNQCSTQKLIEKMFDLGVDLDKQQKSFSLQLGAIGAANIVDGELENSMGINVEEALYNRFDEGNIFKFYSDEYSKEKESEKEKKVCLRNLIIFAFGKDLVEKETVEQMATKIGKTLDDNKVEITEDNVVNLVTGKLEKQDMQEKILIEVKGLQECIESKIKQNLKLEKAPQVENSENKI